MLDDLTCQIKTGTARGITAFLSLETAWWLGKSCAEEAPLGYLSCHNSTTNDTSSLQTAGTQSYSDFNTSHT